MRSPLSVRVLDVVLVGPLRLEPAIDRDDLAQHPARTSDSRQIRDRAANPRGLCRCDLESVL
jgi:hypothetical protein